jgi:hypothetical protein
MIFENKYKNICPIPYAIPDEYIVRKISDKKRIFSELVPGSRIFKIGEERKYYNQYRESRFAITTKRGGWDCLRHYEILASGCVPYLEDIDDCPRKTMVSFPKKILKEAYKALLPWSENKDKMYKEYVNVLLEYCRKNCSTSVLVDYFLNHFSSAKKILMLICEKKINYSRELLSISLRRKFHTNFVEYPKNEILYKGCNLQGVHGNGFTCAEKFEKDDCDRKEVEKRIKNHEFDLIIYGKVGYDEGLLGSIEGMPFIKNVLENYSPANVAFIYGGDHCHDLKKKSDHVKHLLKHAKLAKCFVRELC